MMHKLDTSREQGANGSDDFLQHPAPSEEARWTDERDTDDNGVTAKIAGEKHPKAIHTRLPPRCAMQGFPADKDPS